MKKFLSLTLAFVMILTLLVGCKTQNNDAGDTNLNENGETNTDTDIKEQINGTVIKSSDGKYQVTLTDGWEDAGTTLNEEAVLQVADTSKEKYLIVIPESKEDLDMTLKEYNDLLLQFISGNLEDAEATESVETEIGGKAAFSSELSGTISGIKAHYWLNAVDCGDHFVQVVAWTLQSKVEANTADVQAVVQTFEQIQ